MSGHPLLTAFAEQLGLSSDEALPVLERVIAALRVALESGDSVTLEGIGTFVRAGADLTFEPDSLLVATVNGEYAGLSPVLEPVPVPFLTSFPVVPATDLEEATIMPVNLAEDVAVEPAAPAMGGELEVDESAAMPPSDAGEDTSFEFWPNDDLAGPLFAEDEPDGDLADVMAGVWTPPPSPPVAPLETPDDFDTEMPLVEAEDDASTLSLEEADFSFDDETPAPAQEPAISPPIVASAVAAPFAATAAGASATATPAMAPVVLAGDVDAGDDGGWSKLWLVLPLVGVVAVGLWLMSQRDSADDSAGAPIAAQPVSGASGTSDPMAAGGGPGDSLDNALATEGVSVTNADQQSAPEPVAEPAGPAQTDAAPATPAAADDAGARRPAPFRLAPVPQVAQADGEPAASREPARRPDARPRPAPTRPAPAATPTPDATPAGAWGVRGTRPVDASAGGFTWILASTHAADARERVAIYRSLGFRAAVLTAFVGGRQVYRVAVGQFAASAEAHAARALLPNDAPADAWLLRLGRTP